MMITLSCSVIIVILVLVLHADYVAILYILVAMLVLSVAMTTSLIHLKSQRFVFVPIWVIYIPLQDCQYNITVNPLYSYLVITDMILSSNGTKPHIFSLKKITPLRNTLLIQTRFMVLMVFVNGINFTGVDCDTNLNWLFIFSHQSMDGHRHPILTQILLSLFHCHAHYALFLLKCK